MFSEEKKSLLSTRAPMFFFLPGRSKPAISRWRPMTIEAGKIRLIGLKSYSGRGYLRNEILVLSNGPLDMKRSVWS